MTCKTPIQIGSMIYFCIARGKRTLHSYNGGDPKLDALAARCLDVTPAFHVWYFHTVGEKTYGFLMEDGFTYFAISDPSVENFEALRFLEQLRDGFKKITKKGLQEESTAVIHRLIPLLQSSRNPNFSASLPGGSTLSGRFLMTKAPLLGKAISKQDKKKKSKEKVSEVSNVGEDCSDQRIKIDAPLETVGSASSRKSSSLRVHHSQQQQARKLWWRHVKIVLAIDALLVLVLFGIWLAICDGFQCIS